MAHQLLDVEIMPLAKIVWKSGNEDVREALPKLAGQVWRSELLTAAEGWRPCATTHVRSESFTEDWDYLRQLGLHFLPLRKCKRVGGFAHRFYEPAKGEPFDIYGVVGKTIENLVQFELAHKTGDHNAIGELLGYPKSDRDFFSAVWPQEVDPMWTIAKSTEGSVETCTEDVHEIKVTKFYPECVPLLRYFGLRAVPQIPGSFLSEDTKTFASSFLQLIKDKNLLLEILSGPITWDCFRGVAIVETPWFIGISNSMPFSEKHVIRLGCPPGG